MFESREFFKALERRILQGSSADADPVFFDLRRSLSLEFGIHFLFLLYGGVYYTYRASYLSVLREKYVY